MSEAHNDSVWIVFIIYGTQGRDETGVYKVFSTFEEAERCVDWIYANKSSKKQIDGFWVHEAWVDDYTLHERFSS